MVLIASYYLIRFFFQLQDTDLEKPKSGAPDFIIMMMMMTVLFTLLHNTK